MELKFLLLTFIPLFAAFGSTEADRRFGGQQWNNRYVPSNSGLQRPRGTVRPPITPRENPTRITLSPFRPFGTVPPPRVYQPQNIPWPQPAPQYPRYPNVARNPTRPSTPTWPYGMVQPPLV